MPVEIVHTNEVVILLGSDWFAELSVHRALEIIDRRRGLIRKEQKRLEGELLELEADQLVFASGAQDGNAPVEIREEYEDKSSEDEDDPVESSIKHNILKLKNCALRTYDDLDASEKKLLYSLDSYTEVEDSGSKLAPEQGPSDSGKHKKSVTFDPTIPIDKLDDTSCDQFEESSTLPVETTNRTGKKPLRRIVSDVIERETSDEDDNEGEYGDENDLDDAVLSQQLSEEYNTKREGLMQAELLSSKKQVSRITFFPG